MARTKPFPFQVKFLHHDFFKDFNHICNLDSIRSQRKAGYPTVTDLRCIRYTPDITILFKLNHTNELYTPLPKRRNQPSWDVLKEPHGPNSSSQKTKKEKYPHLYSLKAMMPVEYDSIYDNLSM